LRGYEEVSLGGNECDFFPGGASMRRSSLPGSLAFSKTCFRQFMKLRTTLLCSAFFIASFSSPVFAQTAVATAAEADAETELGANMSAISKAFKKLRSQVADATKNDESLKLVATMREKAEASLKLVPEKAADIPTADQSKFTADFAVGMKALIADIAKLEAAFQADDNEEAAAQLEALGNAQKEGHKEFRKKKPQPKK
jgi:soluble cytochrome b562